MNEATTTGETAAPKKPRSMGEIRVYKGDGTASLEPIYSAAKSPDNETVFGTLGKLHEMPIVKDSEKILAFVDAGKAEAWIRDHGEDGATYSIVAFKGSRTVEVEVVETRRIK